MIIDGSATFAYPREQVYKVFTDHDALSRCTPGVQSMEQIGPDKYEATLKMGVAGISGTYKGTMELQKTNPPEKYTLQLSGKGAPGYVQGSASFEFAESPEGTVVKYVWDVQVGGLVAGVGQRVLSGVAKMMIGQFVQGMQKELVRVAS